jgi:histidinol-phosphate aminotransferase
LRSCDRRVSKKPIFHEPRIMKKPPALTPIIGALPSSVPFVGPEAQERDRGAPFRARIGANESSFGPSPRVISRMAEVAGDMWMYCDPDNFDLKQAAAQYLGVSAANVVVGEGIDGLLGHVAGTGARLVLVPYRDDREDLDGLVAAVKKEKAPLVYLSNPDNPMGSWWEAEDIIRFVEAVPETTMIVLDEAYCELGPASAMPAIDVERTNLVRMRTFSKAYGLAGIRCGYAFGETGVIRDFEKIRNHYGVSRMAQIAGVEALADQEYLNMVVSKVAAGRRLISAIAESNGLKPLPSATNFVTIDCGADGAFAAKVLQNMLARDVFIRKPMAPGLDRCIRVSVGLDHEIDVFAEELPRALADARKG